MQLFERLKTGLWTQLMGAGGSFFGSEEAEA
jgi:hypothetical protein